MVLGCLVLGYLVLGYLVLGYLVLGYLVLGKIIEYNITIIAVMQHKLDDLKVYKLAMDIGRECYDMATTFREFDRRTIGGQLVRAADSVAANISEGYGRFSRKEQKQFCYYARGSLYETRTWITKAQERNCITSTQAEHLHTLIQQCGKMLNAYTRYISNEQSK